MSLEALENKILEDAKKEADSIINKAKAEADDLLRDAGTEAQKIKEKLLIEGEKLAEALKRSIITPARLEKKKKILEEKQRILNEVFKDIPVETREKKEIEVAKFIYG